MPRPPRPGIVIRARASPSRSVPGPAERMRHQARGAMVPLPCPPLDLPVVRVVADAATGTDRSPSARATRRRTGCSRSPDRSRAGGSRRTGRGRGAGRAHLPGASRSDRRHPGAPDPWRGIRVGGRRRLGRQQSRHARVARGGPRRAARDRDETAGRHTRAVGRARAPSSRGRSSGFVGPTTGCDAATPPGRASSPWSATTRAAADGQAHAAASVLARSWSRSRPISSHRPGWPPRPNGSPRPAGPPRRWVPWPRCVRTASGADRRRRRQHEPAPVRPDRLCPEGPPPPADDARPATPGRPCRPVGKGITFDSGGLDIKPPASMLTMKTDMTGAAVVACCPRCLPGAPGSPCASPACCRSPRTR